MASLFETKYILRGYDKNISSLRVNDEDVTFNILNNIIIKYEKTFLANVNKVLTVIKRYLATNSSKLGVRAPTCKMPFTENDKHLLFMAAGVTEKELQEAINKIGSANNIDLRNKVINDTFNVLCTVLTATYYLADKNRNSKKKDFTKPYYYTCLYLGIRFYGRIYIDFFPKADPQPQIMDYTFENMSNKFHFKKANNIFEVIKYFSESNIENMWNRLERRSDVDIVYFNTNMYNRMHESMKKISTAFYKNKESGNYIGIETSNMKDENGDFYVGEVNNISAAIDTTVRKIVLRFISESVIDDTLLTAACSKTKFSKAKMLIILQRLREANDPLMHTILSEIICYYLITYKKPASSIKSSEFALSMIKVYGISNTKSDAVLRIKKDLGNLIKNNSENILKEGNANMLDRVKSALFVYLVLFIVKNVE